MATADVDVVVALERVEEAVAALTAAGFTAKWFEWSVNLKGHSKVSVQISTEEFYPEFPVRGVPRMFTALPCGWARWRTRCEVSLRLMRILNVKKTCSISRV